MGNQTEKWDKNKNYSLNQNKPCLKQRTDKKHKWNQNSQSKTRKTLLHSFFHHKQTCITQVHSQLKKNPLYILKPKWSKLSLTNHLEVRPPTTINSKTVLPRFPEAREKRKYHPNFNSIPLFSSPFRFGVFSLKDAKDSCVPNVKVYPTYTHTHTQTHRKPSNSSSPSNFLCLPIKAVQTAACVQIISHTHTRKLFESTRLVKKVGPHRNRPLLRLACCLHQRENTPKCMQKQQHRQHSHILAYFSLHALMGVRCKNNLHRVFEGFQCFLRVYLWVCAWQKRKQLGWVDFYEREYGERK